MKDYGRVYFHFKKRKFSWLKNNLNRKNKLKLEKT